MTRFAQVRKKAAIKKPRVALAEIQTGRVNKQKTKTPPKRRRPRKVQAKIKHQVSTSPVTAPCACSPASSSPGTPAWKQEDFSRKKKIGWGGFSTVYWAENNSRRLPTSCAVLKVMTYSKELNFDATDAMQEYAIQKPLRHENIVRAYGYIATNTDFTLITEFCDQGDLHDYIFQENKKLTFPRTEKRSLSYVRQVINAVEYLHTKHSVIHMDIKPENVLVTSGDIAKLADFGCCIKMKGHPRTLHKSHNGGTRNYHPPEVLQADYSFDSTVDVWAIGCITYMMLSDDGQHPFFDHKEYSNPEAKKAQRNAAIWKINNFRNTGKFDKEKFNPVDPKLLTFLKQAIGKERQKRPLISQLKRSAWIAQDN